MVADGLKTVGSSFGHKETIDRFEARLKSEGMRLFARIDHAAGAAEAGLELRPTDVLVFGAAKAGTLLMQASQALAIDLPLKVLVWQDESGATLVSYNEPTWIARRHGLEPAGVPVVGAMTAALERLVRGATLAS